MIGAVIVAGGAGHRMGGAAGETRKQYLLIDGVPILLRAVRAFLDHPRVAEVVVVLPAPDVAAPPAWLDGLAVMLAAGGAERGDSVWAGLQRLGDAVELALIHDGARPFVSAAVIDRVIDAAAAGMGAVAGLPVTDTIKRVDAAGRVLGTADRATLWRAQTPQGFPRAALEDAYRRARAAGTVATDDASLFEQAGHPVRMVEGADENLKVTRPADLAIAEALARALPR